MSARSSEVFSCAAALARTIAIRDTPSPTPRLRPQPRERNRARSQARSCANLPRAKSRSFTRVRQDWATGFPPRRAGGMPAFAPWATGGKNSHERAFSHAAGRPPRAMQGGCLVRGAPDVLGFLSPARGELFHVVFVRS